MTASFNIPQKRNLSESKKWSKYSETVIPMWVADSDYSIPVEIVSALKERLNHSVLGYGMQPEKLRELITARMKSLYNWNIQPNWICFTPGVVPAINICRGIMGAIGSKAITALPTYPHLINPSPILERQMQFYSMLNIDGKYIPDFCELESTIDSTTKMLILCDPHNPVGRVYTKEELQKFADIAIKNNLIICSDNIHSDFQLYDDKPFQPIASLSSKISKKTITLMAASKTFNIAGLGCAYAIIENQRLRHQFQTQCKGLVGNVNLFGYIASEAAYEHGDMWLKQQITHLRKNSEYCYKRINSMPLVRMNRMESTYLAWIDASELSKKLNEIGENTPHDYLLKFGVGVSDGEEFGESNFLRINLATHENLLIEGLDRIEKAIINLH
ncbi:MAG: PatB family C-S lyase [Gammaproteobacteria bacterium]|nr:PatB family C-S lyase [Gammaproteobacteria bacterium]